MTVSLPWDLVPTIVYCMDHSWKDLAACARVSRAWLLPSRRMLYSWVRCTSWSGEKNRLVKVLATLDVHPEYCELIQKLEIRTWPLELPLDERTELHSKLIRALQRCQNLSELIFTRNGALSDDVLAAICTLPSLKSLEINGSTSAPGGWEAEGLLSLPRLDSLSIMLPDHSVATVLARFLSAQASSFPASLDPEAGGSNVASLQKLSIICLESGLINNTVVSSCVPFLSPALASLTLVGCIRLTDQPLLDLFEACPRIQTLSLESCGHSVSFFESASSSLPHLRTLKTTHPGAMHAAVDAYEMGLITLAQRCDQLRELTIYKSGDEMQDGKRIWAHIPTQFAKGLLEARGEDMTKFEIHGVIVPKDALSQICRMRALRNLVIHLGRAKVVFEEVISFISSLPILRTLHILHQSNDLTENDMIVMASKCSSTLRQIGLRNRVWTIRRTYRLDSEGKEETEVALERYNSAYFPEALLILRS
ncbi:hypothetical protein BT69DRAFT_1242457 [Atractiella rhizophila]|nr:hypothetical protein BT69DRAFT_1242457 [Atractiella rhizophila]